jgi:hypothetical protein
VDPGRRHTMRPPAWAKSEEPRLFTRSAATRPTHTVSPAKRETYDRFFKGHERDPSAVAVSLPDFLI